MKYEIRISIWFLAVALILNFGGLIVWLFGMNTIRLAMTVVSIFFFAISGILALVKEGTYAKLSLVGKSLLWLLLYFFCQGIVMNTIADGFHEDYVPNFFWDTGFIAIGLAAFALIGCTKKELKLIVLLYFIFYALDMILTLKYLNISGVLASGDRRDAFRAVESGTGGSKNIVYILHMILTQMFLLIFAFCIEYIKKWKWILACIPFMLISIYIGVFYQKRFIFAEFGLFIGVFLLLPSAKESVKSIASKFIILIIGMVGGILAYSNKTVSFLLDLVLARFVEGAEKGSGFERFNETSHFFAQYEGYYYIFGRGFTSFVVGAEGGNNLHLGMGNFILKGGYIVLIMFTLLLVISVVKGIWQLWTKNNRFDLWVSGYVLLAVYTYLSFWGWFPNIIFFSLAILSADFTKNFNYQNR